MDKKKAFSILEFSLLMVILVAAVLMMQVYLKRAILGKWKSAIDSIGSGRQY